MQVGKGGKKFMNLYEIESAIMDCIDEETGEIVDIELLDQLQMQREKKIENILCFIKNLNSDAAQLKEQEKAFGERRKAAEKKAEQLTKYVAGVLNGEKFSTTRAAVTWRKSEQVVIDDLKAIMEQDDSYLRYKEPEPDKTAIKAAIKAGIVIKGAHLEECHNMSIK